MNDALSKQLEKFSMAAEVGEEITGLANLCVKSSRLRYIRRYSTKPLLIEQNVMEHTGGVSILGALFIMSCGDSYFTTEEKYELLKYFILHDFHELATGDVIWPVKRGTKESKKAYDDVSKNIMHDVIVPIVSVLEDNTVELLSGVFLGRDNLADKIVEFFDRLEMLIYIREEERMGNINLIDIRNRVLDMLLNKILDDTMPNDLVLDLKVLASRIYYRSWQPDALTISKE